MKILPVVYHLMRADFLERIRRYSFLVTLGLTIVAAYAYVPPSTANYLTLGLGNYRGVYNSAWIGSAVALLTSALLSLPAFYLVKNTLERDQRTGVGQIIATTPLSRFLYTLGKMLSNIALLAVLVGFIALAAAIMQLIRGEDLSIDPLALLSPFVLITLPTMALVAAVAVLFETISWLRGTFGNVVYFVLWMGMLLSTFALASYAQSRGYSVSPTSDVLGINVLLTSMTGAARAVFPGYHGGFAIGGTEVQGHVQTFVWSGLQWTPQIVLGRLLWIGVAVGIVLLAALFFHRFDPALERRKHIPTASTAVKNPEPEVQVATSRQVYLTPLVAGRRRFRFWRLLGAELRLMLKGVSFWWYVVAVGLCTAGFLAPLPLAQSLLLPLAWVWPLALWSAMGTREVRFQTSQLIFSNAHPLLRQLPLLWVAGVVVTILTGSGVGLHLLLAGNWQGIQVWAVGVLFIPSLALAFGCLSGSSKLFEIVYLLWWYFGPMNHLPILDFMGVTANTIAMHIPFMYALAAIAFLILAYVGRQRQLQV